MVTSNPVFYSQNFEDVLLARCFPDLELGFYIDVGAQDEEADSVTRYFYDRGWSGINIEPVKEFADSFVKRQRDITVCCAAGSQDQVLSMGISLTSGLSSFNEVNASKFKQLGLSHETRYIEVRRLNSILFDLGFVEKSFEFLKIDVEGFELEVIKGIDLARYRPKVILCEVTEPNTAIKTNDFPDICHAIESQDYHKTLFDGLNQWWIASEYSDALNKNFLLPPSVHDSGFITPYAGTYARKQSESLANQLNETKLKLSEISQRLVLATLKSDDATRKLIETTQKLDELDRKLTAIYASRGHKMINYLRRLKAALFA